MSRERELFKWCHDTLECIGWQAMPVPKETFEKRMAEISAILSQPEAEPVRKIGGSYQANGFIVARFKTRAGLERVVFEFEEPKGMLHIFSTDQITLLRSELPT